MADHRHKRDTTARLRTTVPTALLRTAREGVRGPSAQPGRTARVAAPVALGLTVGAVGLGVVVSDGSPDVGASVADAAAPASPSGSASAARRPAPLSRDADRSEAVSSAAQRQAAQRAAQQAARRAAAKVAEAKAARTRAAVAAADTHRWTTTALNLWDGSGQDARKVGLLDPGAKVLVTGRRANDRVELAIKGRSRWVTAGYLTATKPLATPTARAAAGGLSSAPCPNGSVENGLTPGAVAVYRAVCHAFPQITSYGGYDAHGEHASGRALDIMTSDVALGTQIAEFLRANAARLGLFDVIWRQRIWTPERAGEGWRTMEDRGSATANHFDHVHVSVR
ncbi:mucin-2 protein [Nocardioides sp. TRM66260-LWL]|uniref:mucin-2 protein n=1 Tax=Nocardioides sp. TRM66260-LWL TaxID=2874478 RepID=UPI001CC4028C|nr:mucin-2 protein [Nocardioides sp. TRM66260-LWL]MBZ5735845.1 mucin-2 protein [Nocardioides sp. TRM66260-LWL]